MSNYFINPSGSKQKVMPKKMNSKTRIPLMAVGSIAKTRPFISSALSKIKTKLSVMGPNHLKKTGTVNSVRDKRGNVIGEKVTKDSKETVNRTVVRETLTTGVVQPQSNDQSTTGHQTKLSVQVAIGVDSSHAHLKCTELPVVVLEDNQSALAALLANSWSCGTEIAVIIGERSSERPLRTQTLSTIVGRWMECDAIGQCTDWTLHFGYGFVVANQVFDLLDNNATVPLCPVQSPHCQRRRVHSAQHTLDLVHLGNLNHRNFTQHQSTDTSHSFVYHFSVDTAHHTTHDLFLVETIVATKANQKWQDGLETVNALDACVRARQRNQSCVPVEHNAVTHFVRKGLETSDPTKLIVIYVPSGDLSVPSEQCQFVLDTLQRLSVYGTEDDTYGDCIIQKNQTLIATLKSDPTTQESNEMNIYLYLLNNVSILEKDLFEAHEHFNEITSNWFDHHRSLQQMTTSAQMYDVDSFTAELLDLLGEQMAQIGTLIESVNKFKTGLAQLRQSVTE